MKKRIVLITDLPKFVDDLLALKLLVYFHSTGVIDLVGVIVNRNEDATVELRARIAQQFLYNLGYWSIPVAVGSTCGERFENKIRPGDQRFCPPGLDSVPAVTLSGDALLEQAFLAGPTELIVISSLADVADFLRVHEELAQKRLAKVTFMGMVKLDGSRILADPAASNVRYGRVVNEDTVLYDPAQEVLRFCALNHVPFNVLTKFAAIRPFSFQEMFARFYEPGVNSADFYLAEVGREELSREQVKQGGPPILREDWEEHILMGRKIFGGLDMLTALWALDLMNFGFFTPKHMGARVQVVGESKEKPGIQNAEFCFSFLQHIIGLSIAK